ncbi:MAG: transposase [Nonomuraea muscovyensis]|nr:transposase [Nonomuraea muscovyensis]
MATDGRFLGPDLIGMHAAGDDEVMRGDLARLLYEATKGEVEYVFGDSITSLVEDADGIAVTFERAAPRRVDLVVNVYSTRLDQAKAQSAFPSPTTLPARREAERQPIAVRVSRNRRRSRMRTAYQLGWHHHFGPASGSDPEIEEALGRYVLTVFTYGTLLGPAQAAAHMRGKVSAAELALAAQEHATSEKIAKASTTVINAFNQLDIASVWVTARLWPRTAPKSRRGRTTCSLSPTSATEATEVSRTGTSRTPTLPCSATSYPVECGILSPASCLPRDGNGGGGRLSG